MSFNKSHYYNTSCYGEGNSSSSGSADIDSDSVTDYTYSESTVSGLFTCTATCSYCGKQFSGSLARNSYADTLDGLSEFRSGCNSIANSVKSQAQQCASEYTNWTEIDQVGGYRGPINGVYTYYLESDGVKHASSRCSSDYTRDQNLAILRQELYDAYADSIGLSNWFSHIFNSGNTSYPGYANAIVNLGSNTSTNVTGLIDNLNQVNIILAAFDSAANKLQWCYTQTQLNSAVTWENTSGHELCTVKAWAANNTIASYIQSAASYYGAWKGTTCSTSTATAAYTNILNQYKGWRAVVDVRRNWHSGVATLLEKLMVASCSFMNYYGTLQANTENGDTIIGEAETVDIATYQKDFFDTLLYKVYVNFVAYETNINNIYATKPTVIAYASNTSLTHTNTSFTNGQVLYFSNTYDYFADYGTNHGDGTAITFSWYQNAATTDCIDQSILLQVDAATLTICTNDMLCIHYGAVETNDVMSSYIDSIRNVYLSKASDTLSATEFGEISAQFTYAYSISKSNANFISFFNSVCKNLLYNYELTVQAALKLFYNWLNGLTVPIQVNSSDVDTIESVVDANIKSTTRLTNLHVNKTADLTNAVVIALRDDYIEPSCANTNELNAAFNLIKTDMTTQCTHVATIKRLYLLFTNPSDYDGWFEMLTENVAIATDNKKAIEAWIEGIWIGTYIAQRDNTGVASFNYDTATTTVSDVIATLDNLYNVTAKQGLADAKALYEAKEAARTEVIGKIADTDDEAIAALDALDLTAVFSTYVGTCINNYLTGTSGLLPTILAKKTPNETTIAVAKSELSSILTKYESLINLQPNLTCSYMVESYTNEGLDSDDLVRTQAMCVAISESVTAIKTTIQKLSATSYSNNNKYFTDLFTTLYKTTSLVDDKYQCYELAYREYILHIILYIHYEALIARYNELKTVKAQDTLRYGTVNEMFETILAVAAVDYNVATDIATYITDLSEYKDIVQLKQDYTDEVTRMMENGTIYIPTVMTPL